MSKTKTQELWDEHRGLKAQMDEDFRKFAAAEFPPGTKVKWVHTYARGSYEPVYRVGEIAPKSYGQSDYTATVVMKRGGPEHRIAWHLLLPA